MFVCVVQMRAMGCRRRRGVVGLRIWGAAIACCVLGLLESVCVTGIGVIAGAVAGVMRPLWCVVRGVG